MKNFTLLKKFFFTSLSTLLLISVFGACSSSKQAYQSDDGIYSSGTDEVVMVRDSRTEYYQNYFAGERELSEQIFTDIGTFKR